jgi:hypothetical protein
MPSTIRVMTTREQAHKLLDQVPDSELPPVLEFLASRGNDDDPVIGA